MMHLGYANENYLIRAIREVTDLLLDVNSASTCIICYYFSGQYRAKLKEIFGFKDKNIYERDDDTQYATAGVERMRLASQAFLNLNNKWMLCYVLVFFNFTFFFAFIFSLTKSFTL